MDSLAIDNMSSVLLPYIFQTLSRKPTFCDTYKNVCEEIKHILATENVMERHQNIEKNIEDALNVGRNLGILVLTNDLIRMPFKYNKSSETADRPSTLNKNSHKMDVSSQLNFLLTQPRRTYRERPSHIAHGIGRRSGRGRIGSRARKSISGRRASRAPSRSRSRTRRGSRRQSRSRR